MPGEEDEEDEEEDEEDEKEEGAGTEQEGEDKPENEEDGEEGEGAFESAEARQKRKALRRSPKLKKKANKLWEAAALHLSRMPLAEYLDYHLSVHRWVLPRPPARN